MHSPAPVVRTNSKYYSPQTDVAIATQGPTGSTVPDFWRMVAENRVETIVMLTNLQEKEKGKGWISKVEPWPHDEQTVFDLYLLSGHLVEKCLRYWPALVGGCENFGPYSVRLRSEVAVEKSLIRRELELMCDSGSNTVPGPPQPIQHLQLTAWKEGELPASEKDLARQVDEFGARRRLQDDRLQGEWNGKPCSLSLHCCYCDSTSYL